MSTFNKEEQIGFLVDPDKCVGCHACRVACQVHRETGSDVNFRQISGHESGEFPLVFRYNLSLACNHCLDPACRQVCPTNAIIKRSKDGVVYIDQNVCNSCERCIGACPYGAPRKSAETGKIDKCNFCVDRLDKGQTPYCVQTCIGGALDFAPLKDMTRRAGKRKLKHAMKGFPHPSLTRPSTRFLAIPEKNFE